MTTELSTRERVEQAVMRQFSLLAECEEAREVSRQASGNRNQAKNSGTVEAAEKKASKVRDSANDKAEGVYAEVVIAAAKPLSMARQEYEELEQKAKGVLDTVATKAENTWQTAMDKAQHEYDMTLASAEAEVHRAKNEVAALEDTITQHAAVVKTSLNIDLNALTGQL